MEVKIFEVRDRMTFLPMMAARVTAANEGQRYLLRRAGYGLDDTPSLILLSQMNGGNGQQTCDPYDWDCRTKGTAHEFIMRNWEDLNDGDVIDVEYILGETSTKKESERHQFGL